MPLALLVLSSHSVQQEMPPRILLRVPLPARPAHHHHRLLHAHAATSKLSGASPPSPLPLTLTTTTTRSTTLPLTYPCFTTAPLHTTRKHSSSQQAVFAMGQAAEDPRAAAAEAQKPAEPSMTATTKAEEDLPPLSDHDFRIYNQLAERMDSFVSFPVLLSSSLSQHFHHVHTPYLQNTR